MGVARCLLDLEPRALDVVRKVRLEKCRKARHRAELPGRRDQRQLPGGLIATFEGGVDATKGFTVIGFPCRCALADNDGKFCDSGPCTSFTVCVEAHDNVVAGLRVIDHDQLVCSDGALDGRNRESRL